jgi:predicted adenine nucleotide alpha hydrolase (AANH) superfamily ATPase
MENETSNRLLMHICCAPCSGALLQRLGEEGQKITGFWFNPNIHPVEEWKRRRGSVADMSALIGLPMLWTEDFQQAAWQERWKPGEAGRCGFCYDARMEETASMASREGFTAFSTSLLISPYQNHEAVRKAGEKASERHGIPFLYRDFRPLYREGQNLARARGWYMQKYCGCVLSYAESDHPKKPVYDFGS